MKITVDTNVLVRAVVRDDPKQARVADKVLKEATLIAVSLPCLCEFVWVLRKLYRFDEASIATAIRALIATEKVAVNRPSVEAGLAVLDAGGDFADGIMAYEGSWLGAETFVSFDKQAVSLLTRQGQAARLL
ncbi:type II toxin-antitoxin system VapC family toxin [Rhizobacter sp. OV335]|uniref:type II toxin-antitoxin system VapC family toxin n=1 Tax=Rhizobacter sp. OV335 TaxID=1500264 RepID=UPI0009245CC7|nr:type II toxin-antitoxin system VapC family toxin [Rhizobacter sp. OV335]SHM83325.1 Predicted nucleic-acid-binding protein, contains PIN domain [Rhizobacter sp. OV335]